MRLSLLYLYCCLWQQVGEENTSAVDVNPTGSSSSRCDESDQSLASPGSSLTTSTHQKHRRHSLGANATPYSHSKLLQPTVVLRHWNGVSNRSTKAKEAKNGEFSRQNDIKDATVRQLCSCLLDST